MTFILVYTIFITDCSWLISASEFHLAVTKHDDTSMLIVLRAMTLEQKYTWRSLLEHRITVTRSKSSTIERDGQDARSLATHLTFL